MVAFGIFIAVIVLTVMVGNWMSSHVESLEPVAKEPAINIPSGTIQRSKVSQMYAQPPVIDPAHDPLAPMVKKELPNPSSHPTKHLTAKPVYEAPIDDPVLVQ
jgi:hypothetical protein